MLFECVGKSGFALAGLIAAASADECVETGRQLYDCRCRTWHGGTRPADSPIGPNLSGIVGAGFDEFRWPLPVRPGDELYLKAEVLEVRPSKSRPTQGVIKVRSRTRNQNGQAVQVTVGNLIVPRRPATRPPL